MFLKPDSSVQTKNYFEFGRKCQKELELSGSYPYLGIFCVEIVTKECFFPNFSHF